MPVPAEPLFDRALDLSSSDASDACAFEARYARISLWLLRSTLWFKPVELEKNKRKNPGNREPNLVTEARVGGAEVGSTRVGVAVFCRAFLGRGVNPLFIGHPGTGKTFLARALAYRACQATRRVLFTSAPKMLNELAGAEIHGALERVIRKYVKAELVIDDFAVVSMDPTQAKLAFQVISERYEYRRSTAISRVTPKWRITE